MLIGAPRAHAEGGLVLPAGLLVPDLLGHRRWRELTSWMAVRERSPTRRTWTSARTWLPRGAAWRS
eukprot:755145-Alexandrium_andersonii.AAC.1